MSTNASSSRGIGLSSLLTVLFIGLKLTHYIFVVLGVGIGSRVDWRGFCATNHVSASHYRHGSSGFKPKEIAQLTTPLK
jgi:hypothetical protein